MARETLWHAHLVDDDTGVAVVTTLTYTTNNIQEAREYLFGNFMDDYLILHGEYISPERIRQHANSLRKCTRMVWHNRDKLLVRIDARNCTGWLKGYNASSRS